MQIDHTSRSSLEIAPGAGMSQRLTARHLSFGVFCILVLAGFREEVARLINLSLHDNRYSYLPLIPIISVALIYLDRSRIFARAKSGAGAALAFLAPGLGLWLLARVVLPGLPPDQRFALLILVMLGVLASGFAFCYGSEAVRTAVFPLMFLLFAVPLPHILLDRIVLFLQQGSAVTTYALLKLFGVPVLWQRFSFLLPGVQIEIAAECSGIRSSTSLLIISILIGHLCLQTAWRRLVFVALTIPVVIFKNALRIVTISCLGAYVDSGFLYGRLHRYGGLPFSLLSVIILVPFLLKIQKSERRHKTSSTSEILPAPGPPVGSGRHISTI